MPIEDQPVAAQPSQPTWVERVRARPLLFGGVAVAAVAGVVFVLVWFQPQALLFDTVVDEEFPETAAEPADEEAEEAEVVEEVDDPVATEQPTADDAADRDPPDAVDDDETDDDRAEGDEGDTEETAAGPAALAVGSFESRNRYTVEGTASVFELDDGSRILRLEDFSSSNGPDLFVYLTAADHADSDEALDADFVDLGVLTGNIGNQNYDIPENVDLDHYDSAVIWCRRFSVSFGVADLADAG